MEIPKTIKENSNNDLRFRQGLVKDNQEPQGKVYTNIEEAAKTIKPGEIEYITD